MADIVVRSSDLAAPADVVWRTLTASGEAFRFVTRGLLRYPPADGWVAPVAEGDRLTGRLRVLGVPAHRHTITVVEVDPADRRLVTDEHGGVLRTWRHTMTVEPTGPGTCRYTDAVEIDAGALTPLVVAGAEVLYRVRHRRWRAVAPVLRAAQPR